MSLIVDDAVQYWPQELLELWLGKPVEAIGTDFTTVDFRRWAISVLVWDSWLLALVLMLPFLLSLFFDRLGAVVGFASIVVPLTALCIRLFVARKRIRENHCTRSVRKKQYIALAVALCTLLFADTLIILLTVLPNVDEEPWLEIILMLGGIGLIYLLGMTIAMYPGRGWNKQ